MDCNMLSLQQTANCWISANISGGKNTDIWTVLQHNPKKTKSLSEVKVRLGKINM